MRSEPYKTFRDGREVCSPNAPGKREYLLRTHEMVIRQSFICPLCNRNLTLADATFDHETPRGHGGGFRDDRLIHGDGYWRNAAVHMTCNGLKGSRRYRWIGDTYVPNIREVQEAA